jgi:hypothetical protein
MSSSGEEDEDKEDGDVFAVVIDNFCGGLGYACTIHDVLSKFIVLLSGRS